MGPSARPRQLAANERRPAAVGRRRPRGPKAHLQQPLFHNIGVDVPIALEAGRPTETDSAPAGFDVAGQLLRGAGPLAREHEGVRDDEVGEVVRVGQLCQRPTVNHDARAVETRRVQGGPRRGRLVRVRLDADDVQLRPTRQFAGQPSGLGPDHQTPALRHRGLHADGLGRGRVCRRVCIPRVRIGYRSRPGLDDGGNLRFTETIEPAHIRRHEQPATVEGKPGRHTFDIAGPDLLARPAVEGDDLPGPARDNEVLADDQLAVALRRRRPLDRGLDVLLGVFGQLGLQVGKLFLLLGLLIALGASNAGPKPLDLELKAVPQDTAPGIRGSVQGHNLPAAGHVGHRPDHCQFRSRKPAESYPPLLLVKRDKMVLGSGVDLVIRQQGVGSADESAGLLASPAVLPAEELLARATVEAGGQPPPVGDEQRGAVGQQIALRREVVAAGLGLAECVVRPQDATVGGVDGVEMDVLMWEYARAEVDHISIDKDARADGPARDHSPVADELLIVAPGPPLPEDPAVGGVEAVDAPVVRPEVQAAAAQRRGQADRPAAEERPLDPARRGVQSIDLVVGR